jgi:hypothetical protein
MSECVGQFYLVNHHGLVLQSSPTGAVDATSLVNGRLSPHQRWYLHQINGKVGLRNAATNLWMSADPSGVVTADRSACHEWERWQLVRKDGKVGLYSHHATYLRSLPMEEGGGVDVKVGEMKEWEGYDMITTEGMGKEEYCSQCTHCATTTLAHASSSAAQYDMTA